MSTTFTYTPRGAVSAEGTPLDLYGNELCHRLHPPLTEFLLNCVHLHWSTPLAAAVVCVLCFVVEAAGKHLSLRMSSTYRALPVDERLRWSNKIVSVVHAAIVASIAGYLLWTDRGINDYFSFGHSYATELLFQASSGYMIYDIIVSLVNVPKLGFWPSMIAHHLATWTGLFYCSTYRIGMKTTTAFLFTEISTPFMQLRWFMDKMGMSRKDTLFYINGLVAIVVFFIVRVIGSFWLIYEIYLNTFEWIEEPLYVAFPTFVPVTLAILNTYWFRIILKMAFKSQKDTKPKGTTAQGEKVLAGGSTKQAAEDSAVPADTKKSK